jgi:hypothetical protein
LSREVERRIERRQDRGLDLAGRRWPCRQWLAEPARQVRGARFIQHGPADRSTKTCSTLGAVAVLFFRLDHEVREVVNTA